MNPLMKYQYNQKRQTWIVTRSEDSGLVAIMSAAGASQFSLKKPDGVHFYWEVPVQSFDSVRPILTGLGYTEYGAENNYSATTANFQVSPSSGAKKQTSEKTYSVKELSNCMSHVIQSAFPGPIWLRGEVIEFNESKGIHYLKLIDKDLAQASKKPTLKLVIYPNFYHDVIVPKLSLAKMKITTGIEIRVFGMVSYYGNNGEGSFSVQDIDPNFAEGEFLKIKKRIEDQLYAMGIHDRNKSIPMPLLPLKLAVFSKMNFDELSASSDVKKNSARGCEDFINTLKASRYPFEITFFNVNLQGAYLEPSFLKAFQMLDDIGAEKFDLGIIIRGGGGADDLSGFNNLKLATYIAKSPLKFIIGIGHDNDRSVLDEIAHNEKTPTAIGDLLVSMIRDMDNRLQKFSENLAFFAKRNLNDYRGMLELQQERCIRFGQDMMNQAYLGLSELKYLLNKRVMEQLQTQRNRLEQHKILLEHASSDYITDSRHGLDSYNKQLLLEAEKKTTQSREMLKNLLSQLEVSSDIQIQKKALQLKQSASMLTERAQDTYDREMQKVAEYRSRIELLNPADLFRRGFVSMSHKGGGRISSVKEVSGGDCVVIRLQDGRVHATVDAVESAETVTDTI